MENQKTQTELIKDKIRLRYKGIEPERINVIPARPQIENVHADLEDKKVAVYARVSTDDVNQTTSYELQLNHYRDLVNRHENWTLVDLYADEGISGTSLNHRDNFVRMINDCRAGKINLIITKTVARFARNTLDCLEYVRELRGLKNPVGILFETEGIYTLDSKSEVILTILATFAQEESHTKSDIMNASVDMRFRRGIFLTPPFLGYDVDEDGNLIVNRQEAEIVRLIFYMYLAGSTCQQIANTLEEYGFKTKKGNTKWSPGSILYILQNERNCGDILARKTYTPNYLNHKSKKNHNNKIQYSVDDHHEAIISRDDFLAVQHLISNAKYKNKGFLPELKVISKGVLSGFVIIHPKWGSFSAQHYISASESVLADEFEENKENQFAANEGDFDLRKFEVARSQFFETTHKICVTFAIDNILFNAECIRKYDKVKFVEMLIHPAKKLFAVRPCNEASKQANRWAKIKGGIYYPRPISCSAFINTIYEIFDWNPLNKYRIRGLKRDRDGESLIIFDMTETEVFIPQVAQRVNIQNIEPFTNGPKKDIKAFPSDWASTFGENYYRQAQTKELSLLNAESDWNLSDEGISYSANKPLNVTSTEDLYSNIDRIKKEQGISVDG